jgi:hypothetical protein
VPQLLAETRKMTTTVLLARHRREGAEAKARTMKSAAGTDAPARPAAEGQRKGDFCR